MVSVGKGKVDQFTPDGTLVQTLDSGHNALFTTGSAFDGFGNFWVTIFESGLTEFDPTGKLIGDAAAPSNPESILFDAGGHIWLGQPAGTKQILELTSDGSQQLAAFSAAVENVGTDWIDLAHNQCTMYYTSEGPDVLRFDVCHNSQLPNFNTTSLPGSSAFELRILPIAVGTGPNRLPAGSVLVADSSEVAVLDNTGVRVRDYTNIGGGGGVFALNLDQDGKTYWTADFNTAEVFRADIATGSVVTSWNTSTGNSTVFGLSVKGQITAGSPTPTPTPTGTPTPTPTRTPTPTPTRTPTPTPTGTPTPTPIPTPTPTPTRTAIPTPTPTGIPTLTPTSTPTPPPIPLVGSISPPPAPTMASGGPGTTVGSGTFTLTNVSGTPLVTPDVSISFDNADLFASATLTATAGPNTARATVNPVDGGNSPEQPNNTTFALEPPLVVPTGQSATFSLTVTITSNSQVTKRGAPVMYAGMLGVGTVGPGVFLLMLALVELWQAGMSSSRRKRLLAMLVLVIAMASQVGCDNGSTGGGTTSGVAESTQTAMQLVAMRQNNNESVMVAGLPVVMGTVTAK